MFSPEIYLWIIKCHSNIKKMRYDLLISDEYKGFKLANRKSQLNLKALYMCTIANGLVYKLSVSKTFFLNQCRTKVAIFCA